jgi:hypothetical protein
MTFDWKEEVATLTRKDTDAVAAAHSVYKFMPVTPILVMVDSETWEKMEKKDRVDCLDEGDLTPTLDEIRQKSVIFSVYEDDDEAQEVVEYWLAMLNDSVARLEVV